ncbi:hypothetical protein HDU78_002306, partial [Chytriomyces hyalinus]
MAHLLSKQLIDLKAKLEVSLHEIKQLRTSLESKSSTASKPIAPIQVSQDDIELAANAACADWPKFEDAYNYRFFISYRVDSDARLALDLFLQLQLSCLTGLLSTKRDGISTDLGKEKVFLDRECLIMGEDWRDGFVEGLKRSQVIILLISEGCLKRMKQSDQYQDNVLLEWETALMAERASKCRIFPVYLNSCRKDIDPMSYPSVRPKTVYGRNSCSLSAQTILTEILKLEDFFEYDGHDISDLVKASLQAVSSFEMPEMIVLRKEQICADDFGVDSWTNEAFKPDRQLNSQDLLQLSECIPLNRNWASISFNLAKMDSFDLLSNLGKSIGLSTSLVTLDLSCQNLGDDGALHLGQGLLAGHACSLQTLILSKNKIGDKGIEGLSAVVRNLPLQMLDLSTNAFGVDGAMFLSQSLSGSTLLSLNISGNASAHLSKDAVLGSKLVELHVGYTSNLEGDQYMACLSAGKLQVLSVQDSNISDKYLSCLGNDSTLTCLDLSNNLLLKNLSVMASFCQSLSSNISVLKVLRMNQIPLSEVDVSKQLALGVAASRCVQELYICGCSLDDLSLSCIVELVLLKVSTLDISKNAVGKESAKLISRILKRDMSHCIELCIEDCNVSVDQALELF